VGRFPGLCSGFIFSEPVTIPLSSDEVMAILVSIENETLFRTFLTEELFSLSANVPMWVVRADLCSCGVISWTFGCSRNE